MDPSILFFSQTIYESCSKGLEMSTFQNCHLYALFLKRTLSPPWICNSELVHISEMGARTGISSSPTNKHCTRLTIFTIRIFLVHFLQRMFFSNTQTSATLSASLGASLEAFPWKKVVKNRKSRINTNPGQLQGNKSLTNSTRIWRKRKQPSEDHILIISILSEC